MKRHIRPFLLLLALTGFSLQGFAFNPKLKPRIGDGVNEGTGSGSCAPATVEEVKLPIGLPFQLTDASTSGSSGDEVARKGNLSQIVYTFDLMDGQRPESVHSTHNAFEQARSMNAACVLIRMNSFDGALDAAENLSQEMMDYDRPVMVYVDNKAIPASRIISMANEKSKKSAEAKRSSKPAKKSSARKPVSVSSAPQVAEKDAEDEAAADLATASETNTLNEQAENLDQALADAGLNNYQVVHYTPGLFARMIDWCMQPLVSLSLIVLLSLGLRFQVSSAFPGPATFLLLVCLPLLCVPLYMGGLANAMELAAVFALAVTVIVTGKRNVRNVYRIVASLLLVTALAFAQQGGPGAFNWQSLLPVVLLSSIAFVAGWFIPSFLQKGPPTVRRRAEQLVPAA